MKTISEKSKLKALGGLFGRLGWISERPEWPA